MWNKAVCAGKNFYLNLFFLQKVKKPCSLGLYCSLCEMELLPVAQGHFCETPVMFYIIYLSYTHENQTNILIKHVFVDFSGALHRVVCEYENLALLRKGRFGPVATASRCQCGPHEPSNSDPSGSLLVVQSLNALSALRSALQPYCDNSFTGELTDRFKKIKVCQEIRVCCHLRKLHQVINWEFKTCWKWQTYFYLYRKVRKSWRPKQLINIFGFLFIEIRKYVKKISLWHLKNSFKKIINCQTVIAVNTVVLPLPHLKTEFNIQTYLTLILSWPSFPPQSVKIHVFPPLLLHAAYNAIWNPEEGSVTRFLQCKGCLSQRPVLSAAIIAAEIQHPRQEAQDKVNLLNMCSVCTYNSCIIKNWGI